MIIEKAILKLAKENPKFLREIIAETISSMSFDDIVILAKNDGRFYKRREARKAVDAALKESRVKMDFKNRAKVISEVKRIWAEEDRNDKLEEERIR